MDLYRVDHMLNIRRACRGCLLTCDAILFVCDFTLKYYRDCDVRMNCHHDNRK